MALWLMNDFKNKIFSGLQVWQCRWPHTFTYLRI